MNYNVTTDIVLIALPILSVYGWHAQRRRDQKIKDKLIAARRCIGRDDSAAVDQINDVLELL